MRKEIAILMVLSLIAGLVIGYIFTDCCWQNKEPEIITEYIKSEPEVITKTVYKQSPPEVIEVEVIKEVEVIREVSLKTRHFETVAEFEKWVDENHALLTSGSTSFNSHDPSNDCEDQADRWQLKALEEYGYLVSVCPVYNGMVFDTYVGGGKYHVGLWTSIGNGYYYWDSLTGEISKLGTVRD